MTTLNKTVATKANNDKAAVNKTVAKVEQANENVAKVANLTVHATKATSKIESTKLFDSVGISILNGVLKVRFCNNASKRVKTLVYHNHTHCAFIEMGKAVSKLEATKLLQENIESIVEAANNFAAQQYAADNNNVQASKVISLADAQKCVENELAKLTHNIAVVNTAKIEEKASA